MNLATPLLEARDVSRRHPDGSRWLLEGVSMRVQAGHRVAVTGPSGAGKTLLLRALVRLDPLQRGEILWQGRSLGRDTIPPFRAQAIYMHQRPALGASTVEEALRRPYLLKAHHQKRFERDRVLELLGRLGRDGAFLGQTVRDLSGGESQIAALVRALQLDPALLLLDEPTASLDAETTAAAEELIVDWVDRLPDARAVVWVTHDRAQSRRVTGQVVEMREGRVVKNES